MAQLQLSARALPRLAVEPVPDAQEAAALALFRQWKTQPGGSVVAEIAASTPVKLAPGFSWLVLVIAVVTAVSLMLARHPAPMGSAWLKGALLLGVACCSMLLARRRGMAAALLATLAAAAPTLATNLGSLDIATGVHCMILELLTAAVPLGALALWRRAEGISRASVIGVGASGALAGDAALHISCSAADSILHLLVFHVGGVALAAALAGLIAGRLLRTGPASA